MPREDFYLENFGLQRKELWHSRGEFEANYQWLNILPNLMLDKVSKKLEQKDFQEASRGLNEVKKKISLWGQKCMACSALFLVEEPPLTKSTLYSITYPQASSDEHLGGLWYMANFLGMRQCQLSGKEDAAKEYKDAIDNGNFKPSYKKFKARLEDEKRKFRSIKKETLWSKWQIDGKQYMDYLAYVVPRTVGLVTGELFLVKYVPELKKHTPVCPFQRSMFYSEKIRHDYDPDYALLESLISDKGAFYENSLPNFWIDLCTPKELQNVSETKTYYEFDRSAKIFSFPSYEETLKIRDYGKSISSNL